MGTDTREPLILSEVETSDIPIPMTVKGIADPVETVQKLNRECRDKAWSLYYWVRLFLAYGEQYRPDLQRIVLEIQAAQDRANDLERVLNEEAR